MIQVREIFPTFQGEGSRAGQPAVFVRFTGCNLWSGLNNRRQRGKGDCAEWCDTDFVSGTPWEIVPLIEEIGRLLEESGSSKPFVVLTGGEPMLRLKSAEGIQFVLLMRKKGWDVAVETNGTLSMPPELAPILSHVTVSPKGLKDSPGSVDHLQAFAANDLKIVVPCPMPVPKLLELYRRAHLYFQPRDDGDIGAGHLQEALHLARLHGGRVSLQTHKLVGMP